jgi:hypothetical protein
MKDSDNTKSDPAQAQPVAPKKQHRYKKSIQKIAGCPCDQNVPFQDSSFRAVQADIRHQNNFLPLAILFPNRYKTANTSDVCSSWALSMYENPKSLKAMILHVEKSVRNFRKLIGDHHAELKLTSNHGTRTQADKNDHFDFFEYDDCDFQKIVISINSIF